MADTSHFGRLAGTAIVVLGVAGAFLYLGGWLNSEALTPTPSFEDAVALERAADANALGMIEAKTGRRTAMINTAVFGVHTHKPSSTV
jgi:hypothetical protein